MEDQTWRQPAAKKAIEFDPGYARTHSLLAWVTTTRALLGHTCAELGIALALAQVQHAIDLDTGDPWRT